MITSTHGGCWSGNASAVPTGITTPYKARCFWAVCDGEGGMRAVRVEGYWPVLSESDHCTGSETKPYQRADLEAVERLGGVALLVVELRASGSIYVVPWGRVGWRRCREGAADVSVGPDELALWRWTGGMYLAPWIGGAS